MPVSKPYGADGWGLDDEQRYKDHNPMAVPPGVTRGSGGRRALR